MSFFVWLLVAFNISGGAPAVVATYSTSGQADCEAAAKVLSTAVARGYCIKGLPK